MNDQHNSNNGMNHNDNQNNIDDSLISLSLQQLLDNLNSNSGNNYLLVLHTAFQCQLQGGWPQSLQTRTLQIAGCIGHVCQWSQL